MKIKKILSALVASALAFSTLASISLFSSTAAEEEVIWEGEAALPTWSTKEVSWGTNIALAEVNGILTIYGVAEAGAQVQIAAKVGADWTWTTLMDAEGNDAFNIGTNGKLQIKLNQEQVDVLVNAKELLFKGQKFTATKVTYTAPGGAVGATEVVWEGEIALPTWSTKEVSWGTNIALAEANGILTIEGVAETGAQVQIAAKVGADWTWTTLMDAEGNDAFNIGANGKLQIKLSQEQADILVNAKELLFKGQKFTANKVSYTSPATPVTPPESSVVVEESSVVVEESSVVVEESSTVVEESSTVVEESSVVTPEESSVVVPEDSSEATAETYTFSAVPTLGGSTSWSQIAPTEVIEGTNLVDASLLAEGWKSESKGKTAKRMFKGGDADKPAFDNTTALEKIHDFMTLKLTITGVNDSKVSTSGAIVLTGTNTSWEQYEWEINTAEDGVVPKTEGLSIEQFGGDYTFTLTHIDATPLYALEDATDANNYYGIALQNFGNAAEQAIFAKNDFVIKGFALLDVDGNVLYQEGVVADGTNFAAGTQFNCEATADAGYKFVNWTDAEGNEVSADAEFVYTLGAEDTIITANFEVSEEESTPDESSTPDTSVPEESTPDESSEADPSGKYSFSAVAGEGGSVIWSQVGSDTVVEGTNLVDTSLLAEGWKAEQKGKVVKRMLKGGDADLPAFDNTTALEKIHEFASVKLTITGVNNSKVATSGAIALMGTNIGWEQFEWEIGTSEEIPFNAKAEGLTIEQLGMDFTLTFARPDGTGLYDVEDPTDANNFYGVALQNFGNAAEEALYAQNDYVVKGIAFYDADGNVLHQEGEITTEVKFPVGTEFNCRAYSEQTSKFVNWTDAEGNVISEEAELVYTLGAADTVITANFAPKSADDSTGDGDDSTGDGDDSTGDGNNGGTISGDDSSATDGTTKPGSSSSSTNKGNNSSSGSANKGNGSSSGSDSSANTGASALAFVGLALAGSAIVVSKKKK